MCIFAITTKQTKDITERMKVTFFQRIKPRLQFKLIITIDWSNSACHRSTAVTLLFIEAAFIG